MIERSSLAPLALALFALGPAAGQAGPVDEIVSLELLPGWRTDEGRQMAGFRVNLAPGWKTYWRAPGEAGIPPQVDWSGSENVGDVSFHWPVPEVFDLGGYQTYGYSEQVVLPLEVTPARAGAPVRLEGQLEIGVCHEVCVPVSLGFSADLPAEDDSDPTLALALADRAKTPREAGVAGARCAISPSEEGLLLTATLPDTAAARAVVVETGDPHLWSTPVEMRRVGGQILATTRIAHVARASVALDRSALTLTVIGDGEAVEFKGCAPV